MFVSIQIFDQSCEKISCTFGTQRTVSWDHISFGLSITLVLLNIYFDKIVIVKSNTITPKNRNELVEK